MEPVGRLTRLEDAFDEFRHGSDIGVGLCELVCHLGENDCASFCEVARRLAIPGKISCILGERLAGRLRPTTQDRLCDLSPAHRLDVATDLEILLPVLWNAFFAGCARLRRPGAELA